MLLGLVLRYQRYDRRRYRMNKRYVHYAECGESPDSVVQLFSPCVENSELILIAAEAIASNRVWCTIPSVANDQTVRDKFCATNAEIFRRASAAIDSSSGQFTMQKPAQDQAVFVKF